MFHQLFNLHTYEQQLAQPVLQENQVNYRVAIKRIILTVSIHDAHHVAKYAKIATFPTG